MKAWMIFVHSVKMIFGNMSQVMRITLVPTLIGLALLIGYMAILGISTSLLTDVESGTDAIGGGAIFGAFLLVLILFIIGLWAVVAWHRFVLLAEYPTGWIPALRFDRILSYVGHAVLLVLVGFALMIPVGFLVGVGASAAPVVSMIVMALVVLALNVILFRLSPILPAAAIGRPLRMKEAWEATRGANGTILLLLIILVIFQLVLQFVLGLLMLIPVLGLLIMLFGVLISSLINVSLLTTLYGHFVERRSL